MLIVHAEGCSGWTRTVTPLLASEKILTIARKEFHTYVVNADDDEQIFLIDKVAFSAPQLADMLEIERYPAFVLLDGNGKLIQLLEYPDSAQELQTALEHSVDSKYETARLEQSSALGATDEPVRANLEDSVQPSAIHVLNLEDELGERPLAVFFEKPACHRCEHFWQHILSDSQTRSLLERFRIARLDIPSTSVLIAPSARRLTVAEWSHELGVTSTPTVVFFDSAGKRIQHTSDRTDHFRFQSLLDYVISGAYQSDPSFPHYLQHRARHLHGHGYEADTHVY
jgi:thioredoxin-related protein